MDICQKLSCFSARTHKKIVLSLNAIAVVLGVILLSIAVSMEFIPDFDPKILNSEVSIMRLTTAIMVFGAFEFFVPIVGVFIVLIQSGACLYFYVPLMLVLAGGEVTMLAFVSKLIAINNSTMSDCQLNDCEDSENLAGKLKGTVAMFSIFILIHITIIFSTLNFSQDVRTKEREKQVRKSQKQRILNEKRNRKHQEEGSPSSFSNQSGHENVIVVTSKNTTEIQQEIPQIKKDSSTGRSFTHVIIHNHKERIRLRSFRSYQHPRDVVHSPDTAPGLKVKTDPDIKEVNTCVNDVKVDATINVDTSIEVGIENKTDCTNEDRFETTCRRTDAETEIETKVNKRKPIENPCSDITNDNKSRTLLKSEQLILQKQPEKTQIYRKISNGTNDNFDGKSDNVDANYYARNDEALKQRITVAPYIIDMSKETVQNHSITPTDWKIKNASVNVSNLSNSEADILPNADEIDNKTKCVDSEQDTTNQSKHDQSKVEEVCSDKPRAFFHSKDDTQLNYDADLSTTSSEKSQYAIAFQLFSRLSQKNTKTSHVSVPSENKAGMERAKTHEKDTAMKTQDDTSAEETKSEHSPNVSDDRKSQKRRPDTPLRLPKTDVSRLQIYTKQKTPTKKIDDVIVTPSILINRSFDEDKIRQKYPSKKVPRRPFSMFSKTEKPHLKHDKENKENAYEANGDFTKENSNNLQREQISSLSSGKYDRKSDVQKNAPNYNTRIKSKNNSSVLSQVSSQSKVDSQDSTPSHSGLKAPKNLKKMNLVSLYASLPGVGLSPYLEKTGAPEPEVPLRDVTIKSTSDKSETTFFGDMSSRDMFESIAVGSFWRDSAPDQSLSSAGAHNQSSSFADSSHVYSLHQEMKARTTSLHSLPEVVESNEEVSLNLPSSSHTSLPDTSHSEQKSQDNSKHGVNEIDVKRSAFVRSRLRSSAIDPNIAERITMSLSGSPKSFYL